MSRSDCSVVLDGAVLNGCDAAGIMGECGLGCCYFLEMDCPELENVLDGFAKECGGALFVFIEEEV